MPSKTADAELTHWEREERENRAIRSFRRHGWRSGATEQDKETALRIALDQVGGNKKYSWLQQEPVSVANTLGQQRAIELGISTGKLAEELKIGEHRDKDGPRHLSVHWRDLRAGGINMTRGAFEDVLRESGMAEEEIRASVDDGPAEAARAAPAQGSIDTPAAPPAKKRGRESVAEVGDGEGSHRAAKKRKGNEKTKPRRGKQAGTSSPKTQGAENAGSSTASAIVVGDDGDAAPRTTLHCPPTISEVEAELAAGEKEEGERRNRSRQPSPTVSELDAYLLAEEEGEASRED